MDNKQLESLIGMSLTEAEAAVRANGLKPQTLAEGTIVPMKAIPSDTVRLRHKNGVIDYAETQRSIDEKYTNNYD